MGHAMSCTIEFLYVYLEYARSTSVKKEYELSVIPSLHPHHTVARET